MKQSLADCSAAGICRGEWQRIAISRAFMRDESADILIFDEPSSALDVFIEEEIFDKLQKLTQGKTVIIVSHRLSTARFADHIIFLEKEGWRRPEPIKN